tara:strand:+ start:129 stop:395 length:267 start_codon:yes stop_codon:yes gene_type:complete
MRHYEKEASNMGKTKNKMFIVITPLALDSNWSKQECHTPDEAFAIAADLYERGQTEVKIVDIAKGTCMPFISLEQVERPAIASWVDID